MDALVMCGGHGTRLNAPVEKPLVDICGRPMLDRAATALRDSSVGTVRVITSPHTPNTRDRATDLGLNPIEAPDDGHVSNLGFAPARVSRPVVTVASDLPLVTPGHVDVVASATDGGATTACVPAELKRNLGASVDDTPVLDHEGTAVCLTGLGVVGPAAVDATIDTDAGTDTHPTTYLSIDIRLTLNVNCPTNVESAEDRCG